MNICYYFGTFNPVHNRHMDVAEAVINEKLADKVIFVPAFNPPHKQNHKNMASFEDRLAMLKLAIKNKSYFAVSDLEKTLPSPSYTINTLKKLYRGFNWRFKKIPFIIGTDELKAFGSWHKAEKLIKKLRFLVAKRDGEGDSIPREIMIKGKKIGMDVQYLNLPYKDISSTQIRDRIQKGITVGWMVSCEVERYISAKGLYQSQQTKEFVA